jgi:predicted HTH domain antitoxin
MVSLTINLPEEAFSALRIAPDQFATELRFAAAVQWYHQGLISGSKAAQIAGMTRLAFLDELARRRLDTVKIDLDELEAGGACTRRPLSVGADR